MASCSTRWPLAGLVVMACAASACSNAGVALPVGPTAIAAPAGDEFLGVEIACSSPMLVGERASCAAAGRFRSGRMPVLNFDPGASFSSSRPDILLMETYGVARGVADGESTVTVTYQDRRATATVRVTFEDAVKITAASEQGQFRPGDTVTMWLQGVYSVASAETAQLRLEIHDQAGMVVVEPKTVSRGGDQFLMSVTFVVPSTSTELCRTGALEVGANRIARSRLWCVPVRR